MWACYAVLVCPVLVCNAQLYTASLCTVPLYMALLLHVAVL